jgi:hypothetical protein
MKDSKINMFVMPIKAHYKHKQNWLDWLKYRKPIPNITTPYKLNNLLGGWTQKAIQRVNNERKKLGTIN